MSGDGKGAAGTPDAPKDDAAAASKGTPDAGEKKTGTTESAAPEGKKADAAPAGPPEKYVLAIPEAGKVHIDDTDVKAFEKMAREAGWTNDEAQAAVDEHVRLVQEAADSFLTVTKADPDYGGAHLAETQRLAKLGIDILRPEGHARRESFTRFLNKVGASNHIEVVSFLADLGKRASEDTPGQTSSAQLRGQRTAEQVLYDNTPKT